MKTKQVFPVGGAEPNINKVMVALFRPLSPHITLYRPQLTSTFQISNRISGAVLFLYLLCLKTASPMRMSTNSSKLTVEMTALALSYHMYNGVCHLLTDFKGKRIRYLLPHSLGWSSRQASTRSVACPKGNELNAGFKQSLKTNGTEVVFGRGLLPERRVGNGASFT